MTRVRIHVGSIVDAAVGAHAIVNASNPHVALGSGVSGAIRVACGGQAYQRELDELREEEFGETLEMDDCLVSGPGKSTAFRWVLHVPAVDYEHPDRDTHRPTNAARVRACARCALEAAENLAREHDLQGALVLATPLLGAGAGGLGEATSARVMVEEVAQYLEDHREGSAIALVIFVVLAQAEAELVRASVAGQGLSLG